MSRLAQTTIEESVRVVAGRVTLEGDLRMPKGAGAVVMFAHGSGSARYSSRNRHVAQLLNQANLATLLIDLLTGEEEVIDSQTAHLRFNIGLLAGRLVGATDWLVEYPIRDTFGLPTFGPAPEPPRRY